MNSKEIFRVLSIDGGMRGYYSAAYLDRLSNLAVQRFGHKGIDLGKQFQMIVGTSTGAIVGAGLLTGMPANRIMSFYSSYGKQIFPQQLPSKCLSFLWHRRKKLNKRGEAALRNALVEAFGEMTLGEVFEKRKVPFVVPAVNATTHRGWVLKHLTTKTLITEMMIILWLMFA